MKRLSVIAAAVMVSLAVSAAAQEAGQSAPQAPPAAAGEDAARDAALKRLFESLREAPSPEIGRGIEQVIWSIWLTAGSPEADRLIALSVDAMNRSDFPLARSHLDAVIALEPDLSEAWNKRATIYFLEGDFERSLADIEEVLALEPRHFGALNGLGMILDRLGRKREALEAFRSALAIHPQMPAVRLRVDVLAVEVEGREL